MSEQQSIQSLAHIGTSMNPTLCERDMLDIEAYAENPVRKGDVVLFQRPKTEILVVHRVSVVSEQGIYTRGDNSNQIDHWVLDKTDILGQVTAAWRKSKRRVVHGGLRGRITAVKLYFRLKVGRFLTYPLKLVYHTLLQSGIPQKLSHKFWQPRIITFRSSQCYSLHMRLGQRTIGRFDKKSGIWVIQRPYRLLVDMSRLPAFIEDSRKISSVG